MILKDKAANLEPHMNLSINLDPTSNSTKNHKIMQQRFQATKSSTCVDPLDSLLAVYVYQQIPPTLFIHSSKLKTKQKQNKTQRLMLKEESSDGGDGNSWARNCDTCHAAACTVYCRADLAYLCAACDARVHAANHVASRHERVRVCEACERAPAAFLCKADAASLCTACDADIHSANPLARRHQRVSILPISGYLYGPHPCPAGGETAGGFLTQEVDEAIDEEDEDEAASWLLPDPVKSNNNSSINNHQNTTAYLFGEDTNEFLDLGNYNSCGENQFYDPYSQQNYGVPQKSYGGDSIVPVQCGSQSKDHLQQRQYHNFQLGLDYEPSKVAYSYNDSLSNSVSVTSIDVGVVPESAMSEMSISHSRPSKGTSDLFSSSSIQLPTQLSPLDREARVLRYREKKKMRKFEKTIRYASRKAYAETRPRIKGRFAKRTDVEVEVDQMFNATLMTETGYGIVPSF